MPTHGKDLFALLNASLNGLSCALLILAYVAIRRRRYALHGGLMMGAVVVSSAFLASYVYSKAAFGEVTTAALGLHAGLLRAVYLVILIPHVVLAVAMLPIIFMALFHASQRRWRQHTLWSVPALWIWLYVSVTGVVVYALLYHIIPAAVARQGSVA